MYGLGTAENKKIMHCVGGMNEENSLIALRIILANMEPLLKQIFLISPDIRYVAIYVNDKLISSERPTLKNPSSSDSDKYEELIVNPTLLKLVTQRGNIDCGGVEFVIIRYGSFYEFVMSLKDGHVSVGIEPDADVIAVAYSVQNLMKESR
jgi:hypothetical protein